MEIRHAAYSDLDAIAALEAVCFPAAEAATRKSFSDRLSVYPDHFWVLCDDDEIISCVNGMVTDRENLTDDLYEDTSLHSESGVWQMIFGVTTRPEHQKKGYAGQLLRAAIADAKAQGRKGLVLTCKEHLLHYYARFGFESEGVSVSTHGGVTWYQMRLTF